MMAMLLRHCERMDERAAELAVEIGRRLGKSEHWAQLAVRSAQRRQAAAAMGSIDAFG